MKTLEPGAPLVQTNFSFPPVLQGGVLLEDNTLPGMHAHICAGHFTKSTCPGNQPPKQSRLPEDPLDPAHGSALGMPGCAGWTRACHVVTYVCASAW